jgi:hypothetical protein
VDDGHRRRGRRRRDGAVQDQLDGGVDVESTLTPARPPATRDVGDDIASRHGHEACDRCSP